MRLVIVERQDTYLRTVEVATIAFHAMPVQTGECSLVRFLIDVFSVSRQYLHVIVRLLVFLLVLCLILFLTCCCFSLCAFVYRFCIVLFLLLWFGIPKYSYLRSTS